MTSRGGNRPRGVVLVIVLIVVAMLALGAYAFTEIMLSHHEAALISSDQAQARALVDSGVASAQMFLAQDEATRLNSGGDYDNPAAFQGLLVVDDEDPQRAGAVTCLSPALDADGNLAGIRYGLEDESTRLNVNALLVADNVLPNGGRQLLLGLPNMTEEIADAILDWIDPDDEPREFGVEIEYYSGLSPAYAPKNGPLDTVEELLLVRGVTPGLLLGYDVNRNGMLDAHESGGSSEPGMERGWSAYLTLFSKEANKNSAGEPRIDVNAEDLSKLHDDISSALSSDWATFIVAYRQNGPYSADASGGMGGGGTGDGGGGDNGGGGNNGGGGSGGGGDDSGPVPTTAANVKPDFSKEASTTIAQLFDLVGAQVVIPAESEDGDDLLLSSPVSETDLSSLPEMVDKLTAWKGDFMPGRININQAPRPVLLGIPGINEQIVNDIISARVQDPAGEDASRQDETWILMEGIVTLQEMRTLCPFITGGGDVKRGQFVGFFHGGGTSSRAEVVFDATESPPRILSYRDISHLGRGYALDLLGAPSSAGE